MVAPAAAEEEESTLLPRASCAVPYAIPALHGGCPVRDVTPPAILQLASAASSTGSSMTTSPSTKTGPPPPQTLLPSTVLDGDGGGKPEAEGDDCGSVMGSFCTGLAIPLRFSLLLLFPTRLFFPFLERTKGRSFASLLLLLLGDNGGGARAASAGYGASPTPSPLRTPTELLFRRIVVEVRVLSSSPPPLFATSAMVGFIMAEVAAIVVVAVEE